MKAFLNATGSKEKSLVQRFSPLYFGLFFVTMCCLLTPIGITEQTVRQTQGTPVREKQVDVITRYPSPGEIGREKKTVDVREAARNLRNEELYRKARDILIEVNNAYLSSDTVNLLKTALNDNSFLDNNSITMRQRAIGLLGLSRNPGAIEAIVSRLQNDSSWQVQSMAAGSLGVLAGEGAVPVLKAALAKEKSGPLMSMITPALISGLANAGGTAVPLLIEMLKDDLKADRWYDAIDIILNLKKTGDRRVIQPFLYIISRPTSGSDPSMKSAQLHAARCLAYFATDWYYAGILKKRAQFLAVPSVTPTESRKVKASDRIRIIDALKNAGYDMDRLVSGEVSWHAF